MSKNNNFFIFIAFLLVVILGVIYFFVIRYKLLDYFAVDKNKTTNTSVINQNENLDEGVVLMGALTKTLDFKSSKFNFKVNYPSSWSACQDNAGQIDYESSVIASIQSLANKCFVWFAMDMNYQESDVHIDFAYYNFTENNLETWVSKRVAESEKNGFVYTTEEYKDGLIVTTVDNDHKFDSFNTYRLMNHFRNTTKYVLEMKIYILEKNYQKYRQPLDEMLDSFEIY